MKKIINKLFEWLGYAIIPKRKLREYRLFEGSMQKLGALDNAIKLCIADYSVVENDDGYFVMVHVSSWVDKLVKSFPKNDNADYARIRAEKLCDILNDKFAESYE